MQLDHIGMHLQRRSQQRGLRYALGDPASEALLTATEQRLAVRFPAQVCQFYQRYNGLSTVSPQLQVLALEQLTLLSAHSLHFATIDHRRLICFDCSHINEAGQWDIVTAEGNARITFTMASFWSNKLWAWVDKRRPIWEP